MKAGVHDTGADYLELDIEDVAGGDNQTILSWGGGGGGWRTM